MLPDVNCEDEKVVYVGRKQEPFLEDFVVQLYYKVLWNNGEYILSLPKKSLSGTKNYSSLESRKSAVSLKVRCRKFLTLRDTVDKPDSDVGPHAYTANTTRTPIMVTGNNILLTC